MLPTKRYTLDVGSPERSSDGSRACGHLSHLSALRRHELTDAQWAVLQPLLRERCRRQGGDSNHHRLFISAFLWRIRTEVPWRDLPERFGAWNSVAKRFARWTTKKGWQRLFRALQESDWEWVLVDSTSIKGHPKAAGQKSDAASEALGRSRGGLTTKVHAAVDALGNPVHVPLSCGQEADCQHFDKLLAALPDEVGGVVGDKGYDTDPVLEAVAQRQTEAVIPPKKNRKQAREIDDNLYKDRNKVERFFLKIKDNRAVATRCDKKAACFLAVIHVASIRCWLQ